MKDMNIWRLWLKTNPIIFQSFQHYKGSQENWPSNVGNVQCFSNWTNVTEPRSNPAFYSVLVHLTTGHMPTTQTHSDEDLKAKRGEDETWRNNLKIKIQRDVKLCKQGYSRKGHFTSWLSECALVHETMQPRMSSTTTCSSEWAELSERHF